MRLATIAAAGGGTAAAVVDEDGSATIDGYADVGELLAAGDAGLAAAEAARTGGARSPIGAEQLLTPIQRPGAIFCVGQNYREHIKEMGRDLPTHPTLFAKLARSLADPYADLTIPQASTSVDYEGELVIVIGRGGRDIASESALDHVGGYTLMNDVSMRDWQYRTLQWFAGKNFERSTPVGPWVVTPDELPADAELVTTVNGEVRQRSPITDLVFDARALIADISSMTALEPGDLIATGTPGGVGHAMDPPSYLGDGDVVEVTVTGVGSIRNRLVGP